MEVIHPSQGFSLSQQGYNLHHILTYTASLLTQDILNSLSPLEGIAWQLRGMHAGQRKQNDKAKPIAILLKSLGLADRAPFLKFSLHFLRDQLVVFQAFH